MTLQVISMKQDEKQDEEVIVSFSESKPARPVVQPSRKDLKEAEDQNTDKEEEKKEEDEKAPGANEVKQPENPDLGNEDEGAGAADNFNTNSTDEFGGGSDMGGSTVGGEDEASGDSGGDASSISSDDGGTEGDTNQTQDDQENSDGDQFTLRMRYAPDDLVHTQFDLDTLQAMPPENLAVVRFMPRRMDYGTPAGGDSNAPEPGSCPACGDAADAAIIDAGIAPDEDSQEPGAKEETEAREEAAVTGSDSGDGDDFGGGDMGGDFDLGGDFELLSKILTSRHAQETKTDFFRGALESYSHDYLPIDTSAHGLWDDLVVNGVGTILKVAGFMLVKLLKVANTVYKNCRDLIAKMFVKKELIAKFMNVKLNALIKSIDEERFNAYEITAYPHAKWIETSKVALMMFDNAMHSKELVFEKHPQIVTPKIKKIIDTMERCGIQVNIKRASVNIDDNLDARQHASISELGYTVREIPNLLRYFEELSKRVPNGSKNQLEVVTDIVIKQLGSLRKELDEKIKSKKISPDEAKAQEELLVAYSARADFCLLLQKGCYMLFSQLFDDMFSICTKIEDAIEAEGLQRMGNTIREKGTQRMF